MNSTFFVGWGCVAAITTYFSTSKLTWSFYYETMDSIIWSQPLHPWIWSTTFTPQRRPSKNAFAYHRIINSLQYLVFTQSDITYVINKLPKHIANPKLVHWCAMKCALMYLLVLRCSLAQGEDILCQRIMWCGLGGGASLTPETLSSRRKLPAPTCGKIPLHHILSCNVD